MINHNQGHMTMTVYGIFNDEGLVEGGFYSAQEAHDAIAERYSPEDGLTVRDEDEDEDEDED